MTGSSLRLPSLPGARLAAAGAIACFVAVGALGLVRYGVNYARYRGFAPPRDPAYVRAAGTEQTLSVTSPALGGGAQPAVVYLPPGYDASPERRYPVLYLLHGFPGRPLAFLQTVRMGVVEDSLVARDAAQPLILVMPFGSTGTFTDEEWVDGFRPGNGWATFVSRDLVHAVDARYRTVASGSGRGIAGLSEGGYGALDIALHHPREFSVVESWSGYEKPDALRSVFGPRLQLLAANDPRSAVRVAGAALRRHYVWFYSGTDDPLRRQNEAFARELSAARVPHTYFEAAGGHNWALWRLEAQPAYLAAAARLAHG